MNCPVCGSWNMYIDLRDEVKDCKDCIFFRIGKETDQQAIERLIEEVEYQLESMNESEDEIEPEKFIQVYDDLKLLKSALERLP